MECQRAMEKGTVRGISWRNLTAVVVSGTKGRSTILVLVQGILYGFSLSLQAPTFLHLNFFICLSLSLILHSLSLTFYLSYPCLRHKFHLPILSLPSLCLFPTYHPLYQSILHAYLSFISTFSFSHSLSLYLNSFLSISLFLLSALQFFFHLIPLYLSFLLSSSLPFLHSLKFHS